MTTAELDFSELLQARGRFWLVNSANKLKSGEKPTSKNIEVMSDCVDDLHDLGLHELAHQVDDAMCNWAGLLL